MKKKNSVLAAVLALLLTLALLPLPAAKTGAVSGESMRTVPAGYNAHDYEKCAAFLELTDADGTKNGVKLSSNYNVNDPSTWGTSYGPDEDWDYTYVPCFSWYSNGSELMLRRVCVESGSLCGYLDLSGCTMLNFVHCPVNSLSGLDVSGCAELEYLCCYGNSFEELIVSGCTALTDLDCASTGITELDISDCTALLSLTCQINGLTELDVSHCTELTYLHCEHNRLTSLNVSGCAHLSMLFCFENELTSLDLSGSAELERLVCYDNNLTELNLSANPMLNYLDCTNNRLRMLRLSENDSLPLNTVLAVGSGAFDCEIYFPANDVLMHASPASGEEFLGWYNENDERISSGLTFTGVYNGENTIFAKFSSASIVPGSGDADGNGSVNVSDALLALRRAMGLIGDEAINTEAADMDGDGAVSVSDAVTILRTAMGLIDSF